MVSNLNKDESYSALVEKDLRTSAEVKLAMLDDVGSIVEIARVWATALSNGNKIMFCGNGGSAADSQHLAAEFVGRFQRERGPLPSLALTVDSSILTAVSNDYGFEQVFARQVSAHGVKGDVLVGLTTSGDSSNVLMAFETASELGITTIAFSGNSGRAIEIADYCVAVPSGETPRIQEVHIAVGHVLCGLVDEMNSTG